MFSYLSVTWCLISKLEILVGLNILDKNSHKLNKKKTFIQKLYNAKFGSGQKIGVVNSHTLSWVFTEWPYTVYTRASAMQYFVNSALLKNNIRTWGSLCSGGRPVESSGICRSGGRPDHRRCRHSGGWREHRRCHHSEDGRNAAGERRRRHRWRR